MQASVVYSMFSLQACSTYKVEVILQILCVYIVCLYDIIMEAIRASYYLKQEDRLFRETQIRILKKTAYPSQASP